MNKKTNSRSKWLTEWPWRILAMVTFVFPGVQAQVLDVGTDLTLPPGVHAYESIIVHNGATLTLQSDPLAGAGVTLETATLIIEAGASVSAAGTGFTPGGGPGGSTNDRVGAAHGGRGGGTTSTTIVYGSATRPLTLGSGGSGGTGAGGGAVRMVIAGLLQLDGTLTASATGRSHAGGSILIEAERVQGAGHIQANGSPGECSSCTATFPGGGGGRIAIYYHSRDFTGTLQALGGPDSKGGRSTSMSGQDGTVGWFDVSDPARVRLTAGHSWRFQSSDALDGEIVYQSIDLVGTTTAMEAGVTEVRAVEDFRLRRLAETNATRLGLYAATGVVTLAAANLTVEMECAIEAVGKGFSPGQGPGGSANEWVGAAHGGRGGGTTSTEVVYGSATWPLTLGSGGGGGTGTGGGAIRLTIDGVLHIDGTLTADASGRSHAGGSILIEAERVQGAGHIQANGSPGECPSCTATFPGGGGGRIAMYYHTRDFTGTVEALGGSDSKGGRSSSMTGENGTVGWFDVSDPARVRLTAGHSWRFQSSDAVGGEIVFEDVTLHDTIASVEEGVRRIRAARDFNLSRTAETNSCILGLYGPTGTLTFAGQRIGIGAGCVVSVSGKGFGPGEGPGASASATGAGHGGGGGGSFGLGGPTYGSERYPVAWGSSSEDPNGRGGGALHVVATELLHLDGLFEADAVRGNAGGSSGGSIWVEAGRVEGAGILQANGARGGCTACSTEFGGGGGGRIAIHFAERAFAGAAHATGGLDNHNVPSGQNGTVLWVREVPIQIGDTVRVAHEPLVHYTFRLDWPDPADTVVLVRLTPREAVGDWTLAGEFGHTTAGQTAPWRGVTVGAPPQTGFEMLVPLSAPGRYYFDVVNTVWNLDEPAGAFDLEVVDVDRYVVPSSLGSGGNTGTATLTLVGTGFEPGMRVRLRDASSQTLREFAAAEFDSIGLALTADLTGLAPGVVDVVVVWPDATEIVLSQAFSITGGAAGRLALSAEFPGSVRSLRVYTMWIDCANTGATDLPVPLLRISSLDNRTMRLSPADPFVHGPLWALPIREVAPYEVLPPGGRIRFPVEVIPEGGQHTLNKFLIEAVGAVDEPVRWDDLKLGARPEGVSPDAWEIIWSNFTPEMGNTWAEFIQKLRQDAVYLARLGNPTRDVRRLLDLEFAAASGSTGMDRPFLRQTDASSTAADAPPLAFVRYHNNLIFGRSEESPLGLGWTHHYDFRLTRPKPDLVQIQLPSRFVRRFYRSPRGEWQPGRYDHGRLSETAGRFSLEDGQRTLRFDADGRLESIARTDGRAITLSYAQGQLSEARHSNGERLQLAYAGERLSALTDHAGRQTLYTYTGNRLTSVAHPDGRMSRYDYHTTGAARNALLSVRLAGGPQRDFAYSVTGRLAAQSDADGAHRIEYRYPDLGTIEVLNALAETVRLDFDGDKLPLRLTAPLGQQWQFAYREAERWQRLRFSDGSQLEVTYDASGNPVELVDPSGQRLRMEFTPALRQLRWLEDGLGLRTFFAYAAQGSLTNIVYADGSQERFAVDGAGRTTQIVNRRGQTIDLVRNPRGRIIEKRVGALPVATYEHDTASRLAVFTDALGTTRLGLDARDRLTAITNGHGQTLTFELDAAGRRQRVTDQTGFAIVYEYNQHGFLEAVRDRNGSPIMNYAYDTAGRLERETRGNGVITTYAYDANGRVIELTHARADGPLERFSYAYSRNGKCASVRNLAGQETRFAYDRAGRLARVDYADGDFEAFIYDTAGNRTAVMSPLGTVSYAANALHQYTRAGDRSFTYDPAGNLIGDGARALSYDAEGRLTQIDVAGAPAWRCEYDALGQRLRTASSSETNRFLLDPTGIGWVVSELDDAGVTRARYLYGLRLIARIDESGAIQYYGFDRAGHTRVLTDAAGAVLNTYAYSPFGEERTIEETVDNPYRFGGAWGARSDSQGLLFMRHRYYDPQLGRYLSPDPLRLAGGPHLYAYAANDPVNLFDPDGLSGGSLPKDVSWSLVKGNTPKEIAKDNVVKWFLRQIVDGIDEISDFDPDTIQKIEEMPTEDHMYKELTGEPNQQFRPEQIEAAEKGLKDTVVDILSKLVQGVTWKDLIPDPDWDATQLSTGADPAPTPMFTPDFIDLALAVQGESVTPGDPNEKTGSASSSVNGIATPDDTLHYTIYFENDPRLANAPAQEVTITDALDPNLDWSTFRLAEIAWGAITVSLPADAAQLQTYVTVPDHRPEIDKAWRVDIAAEVGGGGTALWSMRTIDPLTEDLPLDAMAGFLPVNDDTGRGQGHVAFTIRPLPGLAAGTQLANRATIRFDLETTIQTDIVVFTMAGPLGSEIKNLEVVAGQLRFMAERLVPQVQATLEQSPDLRQWTPVQVVTPTGTTHAFDVPIAVDLSRMFFRLRQGP